MRWSSTCSISGLPRESALPMTTRSGAGSRFDFSVGLEDRNAERAEQIAHGRIGGLVGARDAMALQLKKAGQRGHGRAADADEMNVARRLQSLRTAGSRDRESCCSFAEAEFGFDAEGQCDILARDVAAAQANGDGAVEVHRAR